MKNLLYIGNKLSKQNKTVTTIETLGYNLESLNYKVTYASSKKKMFFRLIDMVTIVVKHRNKVDVVLIDTYSTLNFYYALVISQLCRFFKLKYIPILHGGNLPNRLKNNPKLSTLIFKNAYVNVAPSAYTKLAFHKNGFKNVTIIPNSIELTVYPKFEKSNNTIDMLWVRSFSELYNPKLAVSVLKELQDKGYNASLCMVGPDNDGSLFETQQFAKNLGVEVTFTGKLSKTDWISLSKDYNYFINTTNFDNMPVSIIEALALGFPIVSTNVGGLPHLLNEKENALLVMPNDIEAFTNSLITLHTSEVLRTKMIDNNLEKASNYDWTSVSKSWKALLNK